jgi:hypothetical protein
MYAPVGVVFRIYRLELTACWPFVALTIVPDTRVVPVETIAEVALVAETVPEQVIVPEEPQFIAGEAEPPVIVQFWAKIDPKPEMLIPGCDATGPPVTTPFKIRIPLPVIFILLAILFDVLLIFPFIVSVPDEEWVMDVTLPPTTVKVILPIIVAELDPANVIVFAFAVAPLMFDVIIIPLFNAKVPPAAAVPPPTNVPALDALVMRFTLTLVSIVTVKLLL